MVTKQRNCKKGYPCGKTCINKKRNCKKKLEGQADNFANWLKIQAGDSSITRSPLSLKKPKAKQRGLGADADKSFLPHERLLQEDSKPPQSPSFTAQKFNPHAIEDLSIDQFQSYLEFNTNELVRKSNNDDLRRQLGEAKTKASRKKVGYQVKNAIARGIVVDEDLIISSGIKLSKKEQLQDKSNKAGYNRAKEKASKIQQAIEHPLMNENEVKGYKPSLSEDEAARYTKGSFADGVSFYHGNPTAVTNSMANDGVMPEKNDRGVFGKGAYFAASKNVAEYYASSAGANTANDIGLVEVKTKVKNPYVVNSSEINKIANSFIGSQANNTDSTAISEFIRAKGYDSVYMQDLGYYISFDGRQNVVVNNEKIAKGGDRASAIKAQWSPKLKKKDGSAIRYGMEFQNRLTQRSPSAKMMKKANISNEKLKQLDEPYEVIRDLDDF